jgi:hypothetical protein
MNTRLTEENYVDQATDGETNIHQAGTSLDWLIPCSDEEEGNVTGDADGDIASNTVPTSPSSAVNSFHKRGSGNQVTAI